MSLMHSDIETVPTEAQRTLQRLKPIRWVRDFLLDWAIIVIAFVVFALVPFPVKIIVLPLVVIVVGARQHALGILAHDAVHRLAFHQRWLNDLVAEVFIGWPLFIVLKTGYRPWHFGHHRNLGTNDDPEMDYRGGRPYTGKVTWLKIGRCFVLDMLGFGIFDLLNFIRLVLPYKNPVWVLGPLILWSGAAALVIWLGQPWIIGLWTLSVVTGFWAVFRIRAWSEHVSVPSDGNRTSHRFVTGPIAQFLFFPHNTWCHYEHHRWPQVPYYNLPQLRSLDGSKPVATLSELFPFR